MLNKLKKHKKELLILIVLLIISGVVHGYNMFRFPYYENDEGTYISRAWSLLTQGKLAPYTYWYDHAPAGWMLIALWVKLTGGFFTFGTSVNSGRVLMLLLHLGTTFLLFYTAKKLSKGMLAGTIAVLLFSLSPLGIYFQRRVLLDNIMVFWVFLSLALLLKKKIRLSHIIASAVFFGIAVLTKENAVFFIPAFVYVVHSQSHLHNRSFAIVIWITFSMLIISLYFLYALLNGEFFPVGFLNGNNPHVSLLTTMQRQFSRGSGISFWDKKSDFYINLVEWIGKDSFILIAGSITTLISIIISLKEKSLIIPVFFTTVFLVFLMRGKLVIDFYVIPLIPLFSLNIGMFFTLLVRKFSLNRKPVFYFMSGLVIVSSIYLITISSFDQYTKDETTPQLQALHWVFNNVSKSATIAIDDFAFVDFKEQGYMNADWFWKMWYDPEVQNKFNNDWRNIEYMYLSHEMLRQVGYRIERKDFLRNVYMNSVRLAMFGPLNKNTFIDFNDYKTTNGDWAAIYKLLPINKLILTSSWRFYKKKFIKSYGQIIDPKTDDSTTSEGQAYAMLRAVWQDDKSTFDGIWTWTKDHLQFRLQDKLFSWLWIKDGDKYRLGDSNSASDADEDIALALLFAYKQWGEEKYLIAAKEIINDIWEQEVVNVNGYYYLTSGTNTGHMNNYLINPSYLSPASYRIFALVDIEHPWVKLVDDSYFLLNKLGIQEKNITYLPSNWILLDKKTGKIKQASKHIGKTADFYGYDAFRVMWRVGLDAVWFHESSAVEYLEKVEPFFTKKWRKDGQFAAIYDTKSYSRVPYSSLSTDTGALSVLTIANREAANEVYAELFYMQFQYEAGYWSDQNNYYDQNWAWFGTALYSNNLPNLWK